MAKNLKILEDGFDDEYFQRMSEESIARAERWTSKRHKWEMDHIELANLIYYMLSILLITIITACVCWLFISLKG